MFKALDDYTRGDTVCDMHDGTLQLAQHYKIVSHIRVHVEDGMMRTYHDIIVAASGRPYTNKYLRVVQARTWSNTVVAMYLYDGHTFGVVELNDNDI